jgi:prepilin-type N-terminal cleavage/methylation domain-containing protein
VCTDRGFTLIEVLIAVGLVALVAAGAVGATMSSRSMAVTTAAAGFDSLLDAARTTAREFPDGATIAFTTDAYGDGFIARLYQNRPGTDPLIASTIPAVEARVGITETQTLGKPPFAIALHVEGAIAGVPGNVLTGAATETPCPASGTYHLTFAYAGFHADRDVPCRITLGSTGPATLSTSAPATMASSPTPSPCIDGTCITLPTSPNPQATCPPHYFAENTTTCVNPPLVVTPASLTFTNAGVPPSLSYAVHESYYLGAFHVSDNCSGAISDATASGGGNGTDSTYAVSSNGGNKNCSITITDARGNSGSVSVVTGSGVGLIPQSVCDPQNPARPFNTDIGPDPDGIHEDYSNGTTCASPATPSAAATPVTLALTFPQATVQSPQNGADCTLVWPDGSGNLSVNDIGSGATPVTVGYGTVTTTGAFKAAYYRYDAGGAPIYGQPPQCPDNDPNPAVDCAPPIIGYTTPGWQWVFSGLTSGDAGITGGEFQYGGGPPTSDPTALANVVKSASATELDISWTQVWNCIVPQASIPGGP